MKLISLMWTSLSRWRIAIAQVMFSMLLLFAVYTQVGLVTCVVLSVMIYRVNKQDTLMKKFFYSDKKRALRKKENEQTRN
jgi:hypothetical protein